MHFIMRWAMNVDIHTQEEPRRPCLKDIIKPSRTIASVIGDSLPKNMAPTERQEKVISMLQAAGFQIY